MLKKVGSCKEVVRIASKGIDQRLTFFESLALRFHKLMCKTCRGYSDEIRKLTELAHEKQFELSGKLDETRKNRIRKAVEKQIAEDE